MIASLLLPPTAAECLHLLDRAIPSARPWSPSRHPGRLVRWDHDGRAPRRGCMVECERVVGRVGRAIDDEVERPFGRDAVQRDVEVPTSARQRGVVGRCEIDIHQGEDRPQEALCLAQGQPEDEPKRQCGRDREIGKPFLPTGLTGRRRAPRVPGVGREPQEDRSSSALVHGLRQTRRSSRLPIRAMALTPGTTLGPYSVTGPSCSRRTRFSSRRYSIRSS